LTQAGKARILVDVKWLWLLIAAGLVGPTAALAAPTSPTVTATHNHVTCTWRTELGGSSACQRADGTGYIVAMSQRLVMVETATTKVRFWRNQPVQSRGYGALVDNRITFTETHNNVTCFWTALDGGAAFCNKSDRHGYVAGLSQRRIMVANEASKVVYLANQP
jgi:hypothetical protein